ncbi:MAG TPA: hypothetical protein VM183_18450 [Burkholderiales bacterium]|nr:hypothetical protein [Burkholderiales bacterium]
MQYSQSSGMAWAPLGSLVVGVALLGTLPYLLRPELAVALPQEFFISGPALLRCPTCGWIEGKREIAPQVFEYTLRMGDGSVSVFQETLPTTWHVGERMLVIEGVDSPE